MSVIHKHKSAINWHVPTSVSWSKSVIIFFLLTSSGLWFWNYMIVSQVDAAVRAREELLYSRPPLIFSVFIEKWDFLFPSLVASIKHVMVSLVVGSVLGFPLGVALVTWGGKLGRVIAIVIIAIMTPPKFATLIFLQVMFGHDPTMIYVFNIYVTFTLNLFFGFFAAQSMLYAKNKVSQDTLHAVVLCMSSRRQIFFSYVLPAVRTQWFIAAMYSSIVLWPALVFSEPMFDAGGDGLGSLIYLTATGGISTTMFFAASILLSLCSLVVWLFLLLGARLLAID